MSFKEFYARYPRKVKPLKAEAAYTKALKIATHDEIMAGLERFIAAEPWHGDLTWCPHPSSWLNAGEWMNVYPEPLVEKSLDQRRAESELYSYVTTGEWRGAVNRKPTIDEARARLVRAGWDMDDAEQAYQAAAARYPRLVK